MFDLESKYTPAGDQQQAIDKLMKSINAGNMHQTLWGVTGSGKTYTMANLIQQVGKPTLIMSHNKTLAAQLYSEFKTFFPNNAVEYFVSYFDYYQPEAYIPSSDTFIEKDSAINDEIERLRLSTMGSLISRKDVIVIASVSCIYGLGSPDDYKNMMLPVKVGDEIGRDEFLAELVNMLFERNDVEFSRGKFRVRGDVVEIRPAFMEKTAIRVEFFGDEIERISEIDTRSGHKLGEMEMYLFFPAKQFVTSQVKMKTAIVAIRKEMKARVAEFEKTGRLIEAQRIKMRTEYDIEMMQEMGFCQGIENYSRHVTGREKGATPYTLLDFFPDDFLLLADESHATLPQVGGMFEGDKSRKGVLVEHGFRLPSALDNRPLRFEEYMKKTHQRVYVTATPGPFEFINCRPDNKTYIPWVKGELSANQAIKLLRKQVTPSNTLDTVDEFDVNSRGATLMVQQIIRPTGLLDPILTLKPLDGQIDSTIELCHDRVKKNERVLVTTLTKKTAEELTEYLLEVGLKVRYIHADIDAVERVEILRQLRAAEFDVLVGINLLREGLDLPEVSLVCILDADNEGFLRNETSLVQTAGRAARHINGECVLFCDKVTDSIQALIDITEFRRGVQVAHNEKHGITPQSVVRAVQQSLSMAEETKAAASMVNQSLVAEGEMDYDVMQVLSELETEMRDAAAKLEFERAGHLRDQIKELKKKAGIEDKPAIPAKKKREIDYRNL
ncbi:MAG: excinuclease ABC subunit B [Cryomorphaceae bacterium]|jgi:excinuclease ABC subunit B